MIGRAHALHAAALCALTLAGAAALMQQRAEIEPPLLLGASALLIGLTALALRVARGALPGWRSLLIWAALLRLAGVFGQPILEDDFYRYLWDGYRVVEFGTPYGIAPEQFFADGSVPEPMQSVLDGINYPELPTIYAPVNQALFALAHLIAPGELWPLQATLAAVDLALLALLWRLGARGGAWLYALSPLVLKEIAFTAHPDGVGAALIVLALWARVQGRHVLLAIACGLAAATKVFALPLIPFLLWRLAPRWWLLAGASVLVAYAPFLAQGADFVSLAVFAQHWQFNPLLFGVARATLGDAFDPRLLCAVVYALFWCAMLRRFHVDTAPGWQLPRGDLIVGALLLLSPVVNAWYLLWLLPFAALRFSYTAWTAAALVLLSYWHPPGDYRLAPWVFWTQFSGLALAAAFDLLRWKKTGRSAAHGGRLNRNSRPPGRSDAAPA